MIFSRIKENLNELKFILHQLSQNEYNQEIKILNNATIGAHTRHIIELFQCLLSQYETGIINYDSRKRDNEIENNKNIALYCLENIENEIDKNDKKLKLKTINETNEVLLEASYLRELYYNYEHAIHHQAFIKIAINHLSHIEIPKYFGMAYSTIKSREKASQV